MTLDTYWLVIGPSVLLGLSLIGWIGLLVVPHPPTTQLTPKSSATPAEAEARRVNANETLGKVVSIIREWRGQQESPNVAGAPRRHEQDQN